MKSEIKVFDPPMCCSTGVCGPSVNPELIRFAGDLDELKQRGVTVKRFNLSSEPDAFVAEPLVKEALAKEGNGCLPLVLANGGIASKGNYPPRKELMQWAGLDAEKETAPAAKPKAKEFSDCGSGCSCNCAPSSQKIKKVAGSVVLVAAVAVLGVKLATARPTEPVVTQDTAAFPVAGLTSAKPADKPAAPAVPVVQKISALSDLNKVAINQDAVLVYIPASGSAILPEAAQFAMQKAQGTLNKSKIALGLFTLPEDSSDYAMLAAQTKAPAILVAAKGRGMLAIPAADTTETKILQAFMTASSSGGCGSGGCGPTGCN